MVTSSQLRSQVKEKLVRFLSLVGGLMLGSLISAVAHASSTSASAFGPVGSEDVDWDSVSDSVSSAEPDEASPDEIFSEMLRSGSQDASDDEEKAAPQGPASYRVTIDVFKRPAGLGVNKEFMVVRKDGEVERAYVVSTAKNGKITIEGRYGLTVEYRKSKPYPWHTSSTYANSPMYWGLNISGGYWIHSTPHYGQLGAPASMGCVRTTFPAAMEIFDVVANQVSGSAQIRIHGSGSASAKAALQEILATKRAANGAVMSLDEIRSEVQSDLDDAHAVTRGDYGGLGHARRGVSLRFPKCKDVDCFSYFGRVKPRGAL